MKWFVSGPKNAERYSSITNITSNHVRGYGSLYIPTILVKAVSNLFYLVDDQSPMAFRDIQRILEENNMNRGSLAISSMVWHDHTPTPSDNRHRECECDRLDGTEVSLDEMLGGIMNRSHPGCDCHIVVTFSNGHQEVVTTSTNNVSFNVEREHSGWGLFDEEEDLASAVREPSGPTEGYEYNAPEEEAGGLGERMY